MVVDPGTGLTLLGTAIGSAKIVEKILGPTAEFLGGGMRDWTERGSRNVARIFQKAATLLGERIDNPGSVPPKVLKEILAEGAFTEDELASDYFAGVLASSKSESSRDDRGATFAAQIGRLSTYQLRAHFVFYTLVREIFSGMNLNLGMVTERSQCKLYVPSDSFESGMDFRPDERVRVLLTHILFGLHREGLIDADFEVGSTAEMQRYVPDADRPGLIFTPSALGIELFLWAHGRGDATISEILDPALRLESTVDIRTVPGIRSVTHPDRKL